MSTTIWRLLRGIAGLDHGRHCRRCGEAVLRSDRFAMSEGVCGPCRSEAGA